MTTVFYLTLCIVFTKLLRPTEYRTLLVFSDSISGREIRLSWGRIINYLYRYFMRCVTENRPKVEYFILAYGRLRWFSLRSQHNHVQSIFVKEEVIFVL